MLAVVVTVLLAAHPTPNEGAPSKELSAGVDEATAAATEDSDEDRNEDRDEDRDEDKHEDNHEDKHEDNHEDKHEDKHEDSHEDSDISGDGGRGRAAQPDADSLVDDLFAGRWLDPSDPYWAPRRGERFELSLLLGGEAAFEAVSTDKLPSVGGMVLNSLGRYYPVDRLAVVFGWRTYVGLDGVPATGTTAATVVSLITGIRYDLVRENRFSLLWDLYSGPSLYVFADLPTTDLVIDTTALGGEMGTGLALRYSVGPVTGEARGLVGGRAGAASNPLDGSGGPFSAVYAGFDVGVTWSLQ